MKLVKKIVLLLLLTIVTAGVLLYIFIQTQKPQYSGTVSFKDIDSVVTVYYDNYGIPHVYGQNSQDVFRALGYVHAQDRLFQMEMIRRVSAGRLSEILGSKFIETDKFFRMLGIAQQADKLTNEFYSDTTQEWKKATIAYVDGINQYIDQRSRRLEFKLLKIPSTHFSVKDVYLTIGYMAFNFQMAFRTDPLMTKIKNEFGKQYLTDLGIGPGNFKTDTTSYDSIQSVTASIENITSLLPVKIWAGSNSFVISSQRSASGKVLVENDTHIGLQQPAVWYESYLNYPGFQFYGNFLPGFPFAAIGHTPDHAWGVTMLENDDLDFFMEHPSKADTNTVIFRNENEKMEQRLEVIKVKDSSDISFTVRKTHHGPICSDVMADIKLLTKNPVSLSWTYLLTENNLLEATWKLARTNSMAEFRTIVGMINAPGLNILYGDCNDNIGRYSAAKFVIRTPGTDANLFMNGDGTQEWLGYYPYDKNPKSENPDEGYLFSTNTSPSPDSTAWFPGYYVPQDRFVRMQHLLHTKSKLNLKNIQEICLDVTNPIAAQVAQNLAERIPSNMILKSQVHERAFGILSLWSGGHSKEEIAPVIYYKLLYHVLKMTFEDELGEEDFQTLLKTHALKSCLKNITANDSSKWWDNIKTKPIETETQIIATAYDSTILELSAQLGFNPDNWLWGKVHLIEYQHPLGSQKPLDKIYNIGPFSTSGGIETINNQSFDLNESGVYKVNLSPALRRTLDFADPENAYSINPSGQSGNVTVRYYRNQAKMYVDGKFRKELMNDIEIQQTCKLVLRFLPQK